MKLTLIFGLGLLSLLGVGVGGGTFVLSKFNSPAGIAEGIPDSADEIAALREEIAEISQKSATQEKEIAANKKLIGQLVGMAEVTALRLESIDDQVKDIDQVQRTLFEIQSDMRYTLETLSKDFHRLPDDGDLMLLPMRD